MFRSRVLSFCDKRRSIDSARTRGGKTQRGRGEGTKGGKTRGDSAKEGVTIAGEWNSVDAFSRNGRRKERGRA